MVSILVIRHLLILRGINMPLNEYITLGRSGLRVSPFCLGGMTFGNDLGWGADVAESEAVLSRYLEAGGNFIDTANSYTRGHSEKIIGDFFAQKKGRRDRTVLATKFFFNLFAGDPNGGGAGRKAIVAQCVDQAQSAYTHVAEGGHFGKVAISIP